MFSSVNRILFISLIVFVFLFNFIIARDIETLQSNWKFSKGHQENAYSVNFNDSLWQTVTIPHDWAIDGSFILDGDGSTGKLPWKGEGWYRNKLEITEHMKDKSIYLVCDGIMAFPQIYVNGKLVGEWDYGYNSFYFDITEYLKFDQDNILAIHADTRNHGSRWYPGGGIFRKIQLIIVDPIHVGIWGTYITTPIIKPNYADVRIRTTINNKSPEDTSEVTVSQIMLNSQGIEVGRDEIQSTIISGSSKDVECTITLKNPQRWDIRNPNLYKVKTIIKQYNNIIDTYESTFGIRKIRFTADHGFYLNDKRVQLKGVNLHHDHGPLGAAFYPRAMERQLEIMKSMGCNAIRTSHNVAAPELLELCDKMGFLVLDEIFDKYDDKADITEDTNFEEFAHRNVKNFIMRDRNHPSIFLWSVGNEISDVQNNQNGGFQKLHTMVNFVRKYDPTRPVTLVCDQYKSAVLRHFDYYDVHSWNYGRRYRLARQLEPNKAVIISESASTLSTRGFYELPLPKEKTDFTKSLQVSSYDLNAPWWAEVADDDFMWQQQEEYIAGEFVWTGFDYLGEPTPYSNFGVKRLGLNVEKASRSSYFGSVDLCGIPKDR
ncbi:MAG: glycoside hydrolase family 2 TIM barrel-domain containing protein [Calditrichaceae bacterium]